MLSFRRRILQFGILVLLFCGAGLNDRAAHAQTVNWQDRRADLGGWLDSNTGLVWFDGSLGLARWDGANKHVITLSNNSGRPWRLPTVAESQLAAAHGITSTVTILGDCWTSETKNKGAARTAHYAVNMFSGELYLWGNNSLIHFIPVYRP